MDGLVLDALSFEQDGLCPAEVDIGGCDVVQAFVVATMVVVLDECFDLRFELTGHPCAEDGRRRKAVVFARQKKPGLFNAPYI